MARQVVNGKAFEFALLDEFYLRLKPITTVTIKENEPYETAKCFFDSFKEKEQETFRITASSDINLVSAPHTLFTNHIFINSES